ncbi:MAG: DEAD/DEAH box helicase family protein [Ruminococcus sp.]|nr:DEAD/DEAH box helicase family protein [Ruminococcus sp.]
MLSEEHIGRVTSMELPLDWNNAFAGDERTAGVWAESIADGLVLSQNELCRVDIEYIAQITGRSCKEVIEELRGSVYQDPDSWEECFYKGWQTADEYLSGNLMKKYRAAKQANNKYHGYFEDNLKALERVMPEPVRAEDIYVTLGSPWVPEDIIDTFIESLLGQLFRRGETMPDRYRVRHDPITGSWSIPDKGRYGYSAKAAMYGTGRLGALHLMEKMLNMQQIQVFDTVETTATKSGKARKLNRQETVAANECADLIRRKFEEWVWKSLTRKERLTKIYEERFGSVVQRSFDGSFLTFPGAAEGHELYPYQKNAVAKILFTPNTLLAHDVGSGKTYIMIAAGMKLRQIGISRKNMYVVPNNLVGQWETMFRTMYPHADLLCITPKEFTAKSMEKMLTRVRDEDHDAVIIAYSCFDRIPISDEYYEKELTAQLDEINDYISSNRYHSRGIEERRDTIKKKLFKLATQLEKKNCGATFDRLGINTLFVDEAHNYKNIPIPNRAEVLGVNSAGSKECALMLDKVHIVQAQNNGRGAVFATATPITNSLSDAFTMQTYLQEGDLKLLEIQNFDSWIGMFAEAKTDFEIDVDTSSYRVARRLSRFHNLPELTNLFSAVAHYHHDKSPRAGSDIPEFKGYTDCVITKTRELAEYLLEISQRADAVRSRQVSRDKDNLLKITGDGRKAALDIRLVRPECMMSFDSKIYRCAENIVNIYRSDPEGLCTQLVFCDISTPKEGFNVYDDLRELLISLGIPRGEIEFVHSADESEAKRKALFAKVNAGRIRVLMGSTMKLGMGVNVQTHLKAIHHLDVPWRPADMVQREGRILRPGNLNKEVRIFRYITHGSFDAYSWQLLQKKQEFISQMISGSLTDREGSEVDDTVLNYAEVKALAVENPLIKERVEAANELSKYVILQRELVRKKERMARRLSAIPEEKERLSRAIGTLNDDSSFIKAHPLPEEKTREEKEQGRQARKELRELIENSLAMNVFAREAAFICEYRGFKLSVPPNVIREKPMVTLERSGRYYVELGDSPAGYLIRLNNCLDGLEEQGKKLCDELSVMIREEAECKAQLNKNDSYLPVIEIYTQRLERLDKELGIEIKK